MFIPELVVGIIIGFIVGVTSMICVAVIYGKKGDK